MKIIEIDRWGAPVGEKANVSEIKRNREKSTKTRFEMRWRLDEEKYFFTTFFAS